MTGVSVHNKMPVAGVKKKRLKLRIYPDPVLSQVCNSVNNFNKHMQDFTERMHVFMKKNKGIGLAAPQVGVLYRIIVVSAREDHLCLVNPKIVSFSHDYDMKSEGCLSLPNQVFKVKRNFHIEVTAKNPKGKDVHFEATELLARVIQHEIDHLNGRMICDTGIPV